MQTKSDDWRKEASAFAKEATKRFLVADMEALRSCISTVAESLSPPLRALAAAFDQNISAVCSTVGLPVTLASTASEGSHWQRIRSAEGIRALKLGPSPGEGADELDARRASIASEVASQRMREFVSSPDGRDTIAADACRFLLQAIKFENLSDAADELLRQGVVLAWSALEMLSRDLFETILNANPKHAITILQEPAARHRLQSKFTLEELAAAGFDLSASLGSLLSSQQDFSDIRTIKAILLPILDSEAESYAALDDKTLWVLCQQRHLIVHRRGIIDMRYIEATEEQRTIGDRLFVSPDDLESHLGKVVNAGVKLLSASNQYVV